MPIVRTLKKPYQIVDEFFDAADKKNMISHLIQRQKTHADWDVYKIKIAEDLLNKWAKIMLKCRENGFMAPQVWNNEIHWRVAMTQDRSNCDQCTMCPAGIDGGDCKGVMKYKRNGERNWTPCWKETGNDN